MSQTAKMSFQKKLAEVNQSQVLGYYAKFLTKLLPKTYLLHVFLS